VDLRSGLSPASHPLLAEAEHALGELACASIAVVPKRGLPRECERLAAAFDVVVEACDDLALLLAAVDRAPLSSLALVQLLRLARPAAQALPQETAQDGLVAESLAYSLLQSGPEFARWLAARPPPRERSTSAEPAVVALREGARIELTLNRPEKRNAFSCEMRDALVESLELVLCDDSIRELEVRGRGPSFCSGGDLDEFGSAPDPVSAHAIRVTRSPARLVAAVSERARFFVHGACVGAGCELPAFASQVVAAPDSFFQLPEVAMGLVPGAGGSVSLPRRIGRQRTAWLALSGSRIDAATALAWGLVDEVRD